MESVKEQEMHHLRRCVTNDRQLNFIVLHLSNCDFGFIGSYVSCSPFLKVGCHDHKMSWAIAGWSLHWNSNRTHCKGQQDGTFLTFLCDFFCFSFLIFYLFSVRSVLLDFLI